MTTASYRDYIASDQWKLKRVKALTRSAKKTRRPQCEVCGAHGKPYKTPRTRLNSTEQQFRVDDANTLEVHHLTYKNFGDEHPDDLIVLCTNGTHLLTREGCHERVHSGDNFVYHVIGIAYNRP